MTEIKKSTDTMIEEPEATAEKEKEEQRFVFQCPSESYFISAAMCRGRQSNHYHKCPKCPVFLKGTLKAQAA